MIGCKYIIGLFFFLLSLTSFSQDSKSFRTILNAKKTGKIYRTGTINDTVWRIFLGSLQDKNKKVKYYVVREFMKLRASSTWHGHSAIYFFSLQKKLVAIVRVIMPDRLPFRLHHNTFYFKYMEKDVPKKYNMTLQLPLPRFFCSREDDCAEFNYE